MVCRGTVLSSFDCKCERSAKFPTPFESRCLLVPDRHLSSAEAPRLDDYRGLVVLIRTLVKSQPRDKAVVYDSCPIVIYQRQSSEVPKDSSINGFWGYCRVRRISSIDIRPPKSGQELFLETREEPIFTQSSQMEWERNSILFMLDKFEQV
jgi:hypothetical protein